MELDAWFGCPPFQCTVLPCIYISGVNMVTHSALGQKGTTPPPLAPAKFGFGSNLVPLSTPKSDSSHSGNGCQDSPRA